MPKVSKVRFRGDDPVFVPLLGRTVEPDEQVEVDASLLTDYAWSPDLWETPDNDGAPRAKSTPKNDAPKGDQR